MSLFHMFCCLTWHSQTCQGDPTCSALHCNVWAVQVAWPAAVRRGGGHGRGAPQQLGRCAWAAGRPAASRPRPARHRGGRWRAHPSSCLASCAERPASAATCCPAPRHRSYKTPCNSPMQGAAAGHAGRTLTPIVCRQADPVSEGGRVPAGGFRAAPAALPPHVPADLQPAPTRVCLAGWEALPLLSFAIVAPCRACSGIPVPEPDWLLAALGLRTMCDVWACSGCCCSSSSKMRLPAWLASLWPCSAC